MEKAEILARANEIVGEHGLEAELLGEARSVGVGGDKRTYTSVLCLRGTFPETDVMREISTKLTNELPINRVTFEVARTT